MFIFPYSHSIVDGGFELMSYTTLFIPLTRFIISFEICPRNSYGRCDQSAVMPSVELTVEADSDYTVRDLLTGERRKAPADGHKLTLPVAILARDVQVLAIQGQGTAASESR